jgi:hypothetical protein
MPALAHVCRRASSCLASLTAYKSEHPPGFDWLARWLRREQRRTVEHVYTDRLIRLLLVTSVVCTSGLLVIASAGAVPKPQAKFWTANRCEQVFRRHSYALRTLEGHHFWVGRAVCVGAGGSNACEWTSGHRSRLYSEFTVFTRARVIGGIVRSFTIATRSERGFVKTGRHDATIRYAGFPAYFYMSPSSVKILARTSTAARFRSIVGLTAARQIEADKTTNCAFG